MSSWFRSDGRFVSKVGISAVHEPSPPCRNGLCSVPIFLCRKISHTRRHSSFFAKRHARLACSLASALSDGSLSLPPFCESACGAKYLYGSPFTKEKACNIWLQAFSLLLNALQNRIKKDTTYSVLTKFTYSHIIFLRIMRLLRTVDTPCQKGVFSYSINLHYSQT